MSSESRTYATTNRALEVKGIGPLSLLGSRIDSGVCCHNEVHERNARLTVCSSDVEIFVEGVIGNDS
jgi:hypothetical protein